MNPVSGSLTELLINSLRDDNAGVANLERKQIFIEEVEGGGDAGSNLVRDSFIGKSYPHLYSPLQFFNKISGLVF